LRLFIYCKPKMLSFLLSTLFMLSAATDKVLVEMYSEAY